MDPDTMTPIGEKQELIFGNETVLGYERPGNNGIVDRETSVLYQSMKQFYNPENGLDTCRTKGPSGELEVYTPSA